jgi:hypothetical protein
LLEVFFPTLLHKVFYNFPQSLSELLCGRNEGSIMIIKTRKCLIAVGAAAAIALYAAGAYRVEQLRETPRVAVCSFGHCVPTTATFSGLR